MKTDIQIGPSQSQIVDKYLAIFGKYGIRMKCRILLRTVGLVASDQVKKLLYLAGVIKPPHIADNAEVDLTKYAHHGGTGGYYLSDKEITEFNDNGFIPPFKVVPRDDALRLNEVIRKKVAAGNIVYGVFPDMDPDERDRKMAGLGIRDDLESRSWNRHFNIPEVLDLLSRKEITQRLTSLFGNDVYLWRSQLFPVPAGGKGTALHQVTDFRFAMNKTVLSAPQEFPKSLINLTVWVALNDVDATNAALIMIRGSHKNNKFEQYLINSKFVIACASVFDKMLIHFVRSVSNDPHARFDFVNLLINVIKRFDKKLINRDDIRTLSMKAGEAVIFTSRTIHGSHGNKTDAERLALGGRYTSPSVTVYPDAGEYKEINHFKPLEPVLLDKYKKIFLVHSIEKERTRKAS